jgi:general secretion pathway protein N
MTMRRTTMRRTTILLGCAALLAAAAVRDAPAQSLTQAALDTNSLQGGLGSSDMNINPGTLAPITIDPAQDPTRPTPPRAGGAREMRGNPLWGIPLTSLTATRERPLFLPSRRPIAPAVAGPPAPPPPAPPPPPAAPDRPRLALVGAVVGDQEGIAVFIDQNTQGVVRLRTGENHMGWILRTVKGREATLEKGREVVQLALPAPSDPARMPTIPGLPGFPPPVMNQGGAPPGTPGGPRLVPGTNEPEL